MRISPRGEQVVSTRPPGSEQQSLAAHTHPPGQPRGAGAGPCCLSGSSAHELPSLCPHVLHERESRHRSAPSPAGPDVARDTRSQPAHQRLARPRTQASWPCDLEGLELSEPQFLGLGVGPGPSLPPAG